MTEPWMPSELELSDIVEHIEAHYDGPGTSSLSCSILSKAIREAVEKATTADRIKNGRVWMDNLKIIRERHARELERARLEAAIDQAEAFQEYRHDGAFDCYENEPSKWCFACERLAHLRSALAALDKEGS